MFTSCFCLLFKRGLENVTNLFIPNVIGEDLKTTEPINTY